MFSKEISIKYFSIIFVLLIVGNLEYNYFGKLVDCFLLWVMKCVIKFKYLFKWIS